MKFVASLSLLAALSISQQSFAQGYKVLRTFSIPSTGGWDYIAVNPVNENIYVSHQTQVNVLNPNGDSVGVINNTTGVHGIAFAPEFSNGYTSNGKLNNVTVFDINTNAVKTQIATGEKPDAIMYDAGTKKVITCNGHSKDLSIIDPASNQVIKTIPLGGKPETAVVDGNMLYVNLEDKNEIAAVDLKTYTVINHWSLGKAEGPTGLGIDTKTKRLFASCEKVLVVMNAQNGKVVTTLPIGDGCDGLVFDASTKTIFTSNGDGTMTVIKEVSADKYKVVENTKTLKGARTIAMSEKTHLIYMPTADFAPAKEGQKRPDMIPGTFKVIVVGK